MRAAFDGVDVDFRHGALLLLVGSISRSAGVSQRASPRARPRHHRQALRRARGSAIGEGQQHDRSRCSAAKAMREGKCHAAARADNLQAPGDRDRLRGAGARRRPGAPGQVHHQPRHRPARLQDAPAHRRGRHQGAARRPPRLHAGPGHSALARGGGEGPDPPPRRRGRPRHDRHHAGRQAHHVLLDPDVRPARRRDHVSRPRLSHLSLDDPVHRRQAGADRAARRRTSSPSPPTRCWPRSRPRPA